LTCRQPALQHTLFLAKHKVRILDHISMFPFVDLEILTRSWKNSRSTTQTRLRFQKSFKIT
jgi:hypothetical protein